MIVVEEKLLGEKTVWYMRKGEQNETEQQVYTALSACGVQNTNHFYALQPCYAAQEIQFLPLVCIQRIGVC